MPKHDDLQVTIDADIKAMRYEEAIAELEKIAGELERNEGGLDSSVKAFERGVMLKHHCESLLDAARHRVETIANSQNDAS
ncbi:MAG: exodeoxyribonuclease VII small subunit [Pseudomonadota bacterium]